MTSAMSGKSRQGRKRTINGMNTSMQWGDEEGETALG